MEMAHLGRTAVSCMRIDCGPVAGRIPAGLPGGGRRRGGRYPANPASDNRPRIRSHCRMGIRPGVVLRDVVVVVVVVVAVVVVVVAAAAAVGGGRCWRWSPGRGPFRPASAWGRPGRCTHLICIKGGRRC